LAVKIVRQPKNIALLGVPVSAASLVAGHERAPEALRAAGLVDRLNSAGFKVTDHGDCTTRVFEPDDEHPRARGTARVLATLEELRPKVEIAVKTGALPLILGGDNSIVLASIAGARRYYRDVSLIYVDRDGGLNVPATTPSGCVDGMVVSHVTGRGAPEMIRFWGEPPLVREPDVAVFGVDRLDEPEQQYVTHSLLHRFVAEDVKRLGGAVAAEQALDSVHGHRNTFVVHIDLDVIDKEDFAAANLSAPGGLRLAELRDALAFWARQPRLAALEISSYNPALDPDGTAAKKLIDLLVEVLSPRLETTSSADVTPVAETATLAKAAAEPAKPAEVAMPELEPSASPEPVLSASADPPVEISSPENPEQSSGEPVN
jgi:arginase